MKYLSGINAKVLTALFVVLSYVCVSAQTPVELNPYWSNWYIQAGLDMSLQNPYGHRFSKVFPNGKTFGVDGALGKWYTPALGLRAKVNWENGIGLFRNNHANWLAPFYEPGVNMDRGGYVCLQGDVQLDLHNLLCGYDPERRWNMQVFVRAGGTYNFGVSKGSPLVGLGVGSTFRINDRWAVYADAAFQGVSSGHTGVETATGIGSGFNGFFDINLGVQYNIGNSSWRKPAAPSTTNGEDKAYVTNRFKDNWFAQLGLDMSLQCPYGKDFSEVFPKGKTFGVDIAAGKWFSPEIALRLHLNWENGIGLFKNGHLEWLSTSDDGKSNLDCGGYVMGSLDVPVSVSNIVAGYDPDRKCNAYVFARAGLISNRATDSASPLVGGGCGITHSVADHVNVYGELSMQSTTSEFYKGVALTGMSVAKGFNCFFALELGVQYTFGVSSWGH